MRTDMLLAATLCTLASCGPEASPVGDPDPDAGADAGLVVVTLPDGGTAADQPCDGNGTLGAPGCIANCAGPGELLSELAGDGQLVIYGPQGACNGAGCQVGWVCCPGSVSTVHENTTVCSAADAG